MKKYIYTILLLFTACVAFSQTNFNKSWCVGTNNVYCVYFSPSPQISIYNNNDFLAFYGGNSNICDSNGNVILATDGMSVYNNTGKYYIDNGAVLASPLFYKHDNGFNSYTQSSIFLPFEDKIYYLITLDVCDSMYYNMFYPAFPNANVSPFDRLYYHKIDMKENWGAGRVIEREKVIIKGDSMLKSMMTACRHANGKDWWLVKQMYERGGYYKSKCKIATILVTKDSVYPPIITSFPDFLFSTYDQSGQAMFNQDGTKYAATCRGTGKVFFADFDRCTGIFSNPKTYNVPEYSRHNPIDTTLMDQQTQGLTFSPNGQFLYVMKYYNIVQLDLNDNDSSTAWYHVAGLDTIWQQFQLYNTSYLGYDNKLYIGYVGGSSNNISVINNPDAKGMNCNFCPKCLMFPLQGGVTTPPNMPNYDLGESGQPCWPLGNEELTIMNDKLEVYPNPTSSKLYIKTELRDKRELYNAMGQFILSTQANEIDVSRCSKGVYYLKCGIFIKKIIID